MLMENIIMAVSAAVTLLLFVFAMDWRYFRDWVVVFLFKGLLDMIARYPARQTRFLPSALAW